jgi:hypothetical protein
VKDKGSWLGRLIGIDWLTRGAYGLIVAGLGALPLVLGGYLGILPYILYISLNFAIGAILCRFKAIDLIIEPAVGAGLASIVLLI